MRKERQRHQPGCGIATAAAKYCTIEHLGDERSKTVVSRSVSAEVQLDLMLFANEMRNMWVFLGTSQSGWAIMWNETSKPPFTEEWNRPGANSIWKHFCWCLIQTQDGWVLPFTSEWTVSLLRGLFSGAEGSELSLLWRTKQLRAACANEAGEHMYSKYTDIKQHVDGGWFSVWCK